MKRQHTAHSNKIHVISLLQLQIRKGYIDIYIFSTRYLYTIRIYEACTSAHIRRRYIYMAKECGIWLFEGIFTGYGSSPNSLLRCRPLSVILLRRPENHSCALISGRMHLSVDGVSSFWSLNIANLINKQKKIIQKPSHWALNWQFAKNQHNPISALINKIVVKWSIYRIAD